MSAADGLRRWSLIVLTGFVGLGGWYGTWLLMSGPDTSTVPLDAPTWLPGGWFGGGVALAVIVAAPMTAAWGLLLARHRRARAAALLAGVLLMAWIAVQLLAIGYQLALQPVMFGFGAAITWLALLRPSAAAGNVRA